MHLRNTLVFPPTDYQNENVSGSPSGTNLEAQLVYQNSTISKPGQNIIIGTDSESSSWDDSGPPSTSTASSGLTKCPCETLEDAITENKNGRRKGSLQPEQRQQALEFRACLRCKVLNKICDKGEPCGGCKPSYARLWQVPYTRMDITDIGYFMKDWKADYERHISLGVSDGNIESFSTAYRTLYITHGYGHFISINARKVFVQDEKCFGINWVESHENIRAFEVQTAQLSAGKEGVSTTVLSVYLDRHIDSGFEAFVNEYFKGTIFITEILKIAFRYYQNEKLPSVRKALKLVLAYNLTFHVTMVEGLSEEEQFIGKIDDVRSKFNGKTIAPFMVNFQIKTAMAQVWRKLHEDILQDLSLLYSSVLTGDKLEHFPTIFMITAILLAIWEEMQFDCYYHELDENAVNEFCEKMESSPVAVLLGLFQAISSKLPSLQAWDTRQHHHVLSSNAAACDALSEVRKLVNKHKNYLSGRFSAIFNRDDFDCLSSKLLSQLVIS
ncbi:hypothetical protein M433DRAFT_77610 [Acidomyces richmondensis BFW]|nr:hypothetical protein M433DRAFT_77610 [Acidomyces richmondensis BFW]